MIRIGINTGIKRVCNPRRMRTISPRGDIISVRRRSHGETVSRAVDAGVEFVKEVMLVVSGGSRGRAGRGRFSEGAAAGIHAAGAETAFVGVLRHDVVFK